jgi:hypothetical protein
MVEAIEPYGLSLEQGINRLVDPNPLWAQAFAEEAASIRVALGEKALAIEHHGSTAVPGLSAKPTIDLQIGVTDIDHGRCSWSRWPGLVTITPAIKASPSTTFSAKDAPGLSWRMSWSIRASRG